MHPPEIKARALELIAAGANDCEVSRRIGVPRRTVRDWRQPTYVPRRAGPMEICPRCWRTAKRIRFTSGDYAELLGLYLGDGYISTGPRADRLRIALDAKYPDIIDETRALLRRCFPENAVDVIRANLKGRLVNVSVYSQHLTCLFPQHGAGLKHTRRIQLEPWQAALVDAAPWRFIRGCIWSDGCSFINRTHVHRPVPHEYLSYEFSNMSREIVELFVASCDRVGVRTRVTVRRRGLWDVRINRRASVALMLEHVGRKS